MNAKTMMTTAALALLASFGLLSVRAEGDFSLIVSDDIVTGYSGTSPATLVIPDGVKGIDACAFCWNEQITSVTIPASVTNIGDWAFECVSGLTNVVFKGDRDKIRFGRAVFGRTPYNDNLAFTPLVYGGVFEGFHGQCPGEVRFADGVTKIASGAMDSSSNGDTVMNLRKVTIPASVTEIGDYAFYFCTNLSEVVYLGDESKIVFGAEVFFMTPYERKQPFKLNIDENGTLVGYQGYCTGTLEIPEGVRSIAEYAFFGSCDQLAGVTEIRIPSTVTNIGDFAFLLRDQVTNVVFAAGSQIKTIGWGAFRWCYALETFDMRGVSAFSDDPNPMFGASVFDGVTNVSVHVKTLVAKQTLENLNSFNRQCCVTVEGWHKPFHVVAMDGFSGEIRWDAVELADCYEVLRGLENDITTANCVGQVETNVYFDTQAEFNVPYYYWIRPVSCGIVGDVSDVVSRTRHAIWNVRARQRYPWNGLVDIDFECGADDPETNIVIGVTAYDNEHSKALQVVTLTCADNVSTNPAEIAVKPGEHRIVWNFGYDNTNVVSKNVTIAVQDGEVAAPYMVIDLSGGTDATSYPVSYLGAPPAGGWTDEYKTTKLVLRRIQPGTFTMGSPSGEVGRCSYEDQHEVTLTKPFYMGVFEVTQRQWELVTGARPSYFKNSSCYAARPVERVSYNDIRGSSAGAGWPGSSAVDATSFLGKLRAKTGLTDFDLPTEAQWEYACRAGTTTALNSGKNLTNTYQDSAMNEVGRYWYNGGTDYSSSCTTANATAKVGSYAPNAWGLYDMHGNVWEWCLDWWTSTLVAATDPVEAASGDYRSIRGGSWHDRGAQRCRSAYRYDCYVPSSGYNYLGFRLSSTLTSDISESVSSYGSATLAVDARRGPRLADRVMRKIAYSTQWNDAPSVTLTLTRPDGTSKTLVQTNAPAESHIYWHASEDLPGRYVLTHHAGDETLTAEFIGLGTGRQHAGVLSANEIWSADILHVVTSDVTVPDGASLTIEPGAIVKFVDGVSLTVAEGASCTAKGAIFTHIADDTAGGDTMFDGAETAPVTDAYDISGDVDDDDSTEYRYKTLPPVITSGIISSDTRWGGHKTYRITGNLTVARGVMLTIRPGAVVKFDPGRMLTVDVGATLLAQGTRTSPVVFTSVRDDSVGGDTNEDGANTLPSGGDWQYVEVLGSAYFEYATLMYGAPSNERGIVMTGWSSYGARIGMNNCVIAHASYDGIWNADSAAQVCVTNTVIMDTGWAVAPYRGGKNEYVNCVFHGNNVGLCYWSHWTGSPTFKNCIFSSCGNGWCELDSNSYGDPPSAVKVSNSLFYNPSGFAARSCGRVGRDGNVWGDPQFVDPDNGDFRIASTSPCVDAGDGAVAPETDYYGRPRYGAPDIGIYEVLPEDAPSGVDFLPLDVSAKDGEVGNAVTFRWTVRNMGSTNVVATRRDTLALVSVDGISTIELSSPEQPAGLSALATAEYEASIMLPPEAEGTWYPQVKVNAYRDVFEGAGTSNNVLTATNAIVISTPTVALDAVRTGTVGAGKNAAFAVRLPDDRDYVAHLVAPAGTVIYYGIGFVPTADRHSGVATSDGNGAWIGLAAGSGKVNIVVESESAKAVSYSVAFEEGGLGIASVSPASLPTSGTANLTINGVHFAEGAAVSLFDGKKTVPAKATTYRSGELLTAQIDCSLLASGTSYDVLVTSDGTEASLEGSVRTLGEKGYSKLSAKLETPASIRQGRSLTLYVSYENVGNLDMPAPIFEVTSEGQVFTVDGSVYTNSVKVMGYGGSAPFGTLKPNDPQRVGVRVTIMSSATRVNWKLRSYVADEASFEKPLPLESVVRADWVYRFASDTNSTYYADMRAKVGATWGDFYSNLGNFVTDFEERPEITGYETLKKAFTQQAYQEIKEAAEAAKEAASPKLAQAKAANALAAPKLAESEPAEEGQLIGSNYKNDNSCDGDVWWYRNGKWFSITNESVKADLRDCRKNVLLICHGNVNSIHEEWVEQLARVANKHYSAVLGIDWGNSSVPKSGFNGINAEDTAPYIPYASAVAFTQLCMRAGISAGNLTLIGHSHGAHVAGNIAKLYQTAGGGKVSRFVALDASPVWTHSENMRPGMYFPDAWNGDCARQVEFYKTSWGFSMGTDNVDELFGQPTFYVARSKDFYTDGYEPGMTIKLKKKIFSALRAVDMHKYAYQWGALMMDSSSILGAKWDAKTSWTELTGLTGTVPQKCFAGVVLGNAIECAQGNHQEAVAYAKAKGRNTSSYKWSWGRLMGFEKDTGELTSYATPRTLKELQSRHGLLTEYMPTSISVKPDSGVYVVDGEAVNIKMKAVNLANNLSIDPDRSEEGVCPWNCTADVSKEYGVGCSVFALDVSSVSGAGIGILKDYESNSERNWCDGDFRVLMECGARYQVLASWSGAKEFISPFAGEAVKPAKCVFSSLRMQDRNGVARRVPVGANGEKTEDFLIVAIAGNLSADGSPYITESYPYDLCQEDKYLVTKIAVKPGAAVVAQISEGHVSYSPRNAKVRLASAAANGFEKIGGKYVSDVNGNWSAKFNGAKSSSMTNITEYVWAGLECEPSPPWTTDGNPNVTFSGCLPLGDDGLPVPSHEYAIGLLVTDALGLQSQTNFYTFTVYRGTEPEEGEDEDGGTSESKKSCDPNEVTGPAGVGADRAVYPDEWLTYTIYFENMTNATGAAQEILVENPLSKALDWTTLEIQEIAFGTQIDTGLYGKRSGKSEVQLTGTNRYVRSEVDVEDGYASFYLRIVDYANGDEENWPLDAEAGILPPNDPQTHCGEGHVTYRIKLSEGAVSETVVSNAAIIVFDTNPPIPTEPSWWNTVGTLTPSVKFAENEIETDEGSNLVVTVSGGSVEKASSVVVYLTYQTAAAADIDLKTAKVDGVTPKGGIKFPLTLSWAAGSVTNHVISIPVKTDKTVEDDETLVFQLAAAQSQELGEVTTCAVTIRDANVVADYAAKQTKETVKTKKGVATDALAVVCCANDGSGTVCGYTTGQGRYAKGSKASLKATARPGWEFKGWGEVAEGVTNVVSEKASWSVTLTNDAEIVALFGRIPYVAGLASPADGGKVAGSGYCAAGKKVTLKSTANKNYTFTGWVCGRDCLNRVGDGTSQSSSDAFETNASTGEGVTPILTPTLMFDRSAKPAKSDAKQTVITNVSESVTYYATFKSDPEIFVMAACDEAKGAELTGKGAGKFVAGTVTGAGKYAAGKKKITLKATANKGYVFMGWYLVDAIVSIASKEDGSIPSDAFETNASTCLSRLATYTIAAMPATNVEYAATFITSAFDRSNIVARVDGLDFNAARTSAATNVWTGVYLKWPVFSEALSKTTVAVSGLPSGLKFTAKPIVTTKTTGSGKKKRVVSVVTNMPANMIYGAPSAASKVVANKKTKVSSVVPSQVKVTVTTAGKTSQTFPIALTVDPLPAWAVGTFAGPSYSDAIETIASTDAGEGACTNGTASVTIASSGKISAKQPVNGKSASFAASWFDRYDAEADAFFATLKATVGKTVVTNEMAVSWQCGRDCLNRVGDVDEASSSDAFETNASTVTNGYIEAELFDAWQYNWKIAPWKAVAKSLDKKTFTYAVLADGTVVDEDDGGEGLAALPGNVTGAAGVRALPVDGTNVMGKVTLKFAASGAVTVAGIFASLDAEGLPKYKKGKLVTVSAKGSAMLVPIWTRLSQSRQEEDGLSSSDAFETNASTCVFVYLAPKGLAPHARCVEVAR